MKNQNYVIITAAYNEKKNIEKTIKSVCSQTIKPLVWIVMSDGSTDGTDDIVKSYVKKNKFIKFYRVPKKKENNHNFGKKVNAINTGLANLKQEGYKSYAFIGILDADISFEQTYFEKLLKKFKDNPKLGIGGGNIIEFINGKYNKRIKNMNSVAGAVQLFRRECFESTDGFLPLEFGCEDAAVEITARMKGWEVETFPELEVIHHGFVGSGAGGQVRGRYRRGMSYFFIGYHPIFHIFRCVYRLRERPVIIGSIAELIGFFYAAIKYKKSILSPEVIHFLRKEQMERLKNLFKLTKN